MAKSLNLLTLTRLLLVTCSIGYSATATTTPNITTDQSSLLALKSHIISDPSNTLTSNWTIETSVCSWIGVTCSSRHLRVIALSIPNMGLEGIIPLEISNLSFLVYLNMSRNSFQGNLSDSFIHMRRLRVVDLSFNELTGELPRSWFASMLQLQILRLGGNSLRGSISEEIGNLCDLRELVISNNELTGPLPQSIFNMSALELLSLRNNSLSGSIPIDVGTCRIRHLNLDRNTFEGQIPSSLTRCSELQVLSLENNRLTGVLPGEIWNMTMLGQLMLGFNNLNGSIPQEIGHLQNLQYLGMEYNNFTGVLPSTISNISSLRYLSFAYNDLSGSIPREIGNLTMLRTIYLSYNRFEGEIPQEITYLHELERLILANNSLTGNIPLGIFNMSNLGFLSLDRNLLSGNVPTSIRYNLPNLRELYLGTNNLEGQILNPISNCTQLTVLELGFNRFSGSIPTSLENLSLLRILNLNGNSFTHDPSSRELSFITSLTNCRYLEEISLSNNPLDGKYLPLSVGNFSASLRILVIDNCNIKGGIPTTIANLSDVETLSLMLNELNGTIPTTIQGLQRLQRFFLGNNQLTGSVPYSLCTFQNLGSLDLSHNQLSGPIPECLGSVSNLRELYVSNNRLDSNITNSLWNLTNLAQLDLSSNFLSGSLSPDIGDLEAAVSIDLSANELTGSIPSSIGSLQRLIDISLANNGFQGIIPVSLGQILGLETLDLSQNNLSGVIPKSLEALVYLDYFNVSFNELSGEVPSDGPFRNFTDHSFMSNRNLCGSPRFKIPPCPTNSANTSGARRTILIISVSLGTAAVIIVVIAVIALTRRKKKNQNVSDSPSAHGHRKISYYELQQATDGFNEINLLGKGGFGSVYKGVLRDGTLMAVKVFDLEVEGAHKSFDAECEVLRNLRHRNLTKIISSCSNTSFKAIILDYMPNGNLDMWLYSPSSSLDIMQRLNIMIDVACALEYLHYGYSNPVIHCDLKPSNVLLDEDMVAHVSDFGVAKLLGIQDSSRHTKTLATIGYMAPEYGMEGTVTPASDVYSYGIMLMEVFTRRRPNDEHFSGDLGMKQWVKSSLPDAVQHIVDADLLDPYDDHFSGKLKCLTSILKISTHCTTEAARERISMRDVVPDMNKIKLDLIGVLGRRNSKIN